MADVAPVEQFRQNYDDSRQAYGYEAIWHELQDSCIPCGTHRLRRLIRQDGLVAKEANLTQLTYASEIIKELD
jgi:hypothetical protein